MLHCRCRFEHYFDTLCFVNVFRPEIFLQVKQGRARIEDLQWLSKELETLDISAPKTLIYCRSIDSVVNMYVHFSANCKHGEKINMYHAHMTDRCRASILEDFRQEKSTIRILISTIAFGMGIDIPDIFRIIHWGPPNTVDEYWQEIGRCARKLSSGIAILYKAPYSVRHRAISNDINQILSGKKCIRSIIFREFKYKEDTNNKGILFHSDTCCSDCEDHAMSQ